MEDRPALRVLGVALGTFVLAIALTFPTQSVASRSPLYVAMPLLLLVILVGVVFDVVGVAVAVADEKPLHAMIVKRRPGSRQALRLTRNADRVSNFCNDVIGDIAGALSGALGAAVAVSILRGQAGGVVETIVNAVLLGLVAATTVSGKAVGKRYAMSHAVEVTVRAGRAVAWLESLLHREFLAAPRRRRGGGR
ncbi:MAG: hypothetical protein ACYC5Y_12105 [Symbiobacteriia bacterium]